MKHKDKLIPAAIVLCWVIYLLFQQGHANDEAEHLHIAWLIQVQGLWPIRDFFEHHQPATWHLLGSLFQIGVKEDWLLFFGRVYVVLAILLSALGLYLIAYRSREAKINSLMMPVYVFMLSSFFLKNLIVIRPETFATPFIIYCVLLWRASFTSIDVNARLLSAVAGMLGMVSVMISPRFAILAPGILFLYPSHISISRSRLINHAVWGLLGSAVGFFLLLIAFNQSLQELMFNIRFSALLQNTGVGWYAGLPVILFFGVISLLLCFFYLRNSDYSSAFKGIHSVVLLFVFMVSIYFMGKYFYAQGVFPFVVWITLFMATTPLKGGSQQQDSLWIASTLITLMAAILITYQISRFAIENVSLVNKTRKMMRNLVPEEDSVLLSYSTHPITRLDPGYYALPILEGKNRLCETIKLYDVSFSLPECDYQKQIRRHLPALIAQRFIFKSDDDADFMQFIARYYRFNPDLSVLIRKNINIPENLLDEPLPVAAD